MPPSLVSIPIEIFSYIVDGISFEDAVSLSRTCRQLQYLLRDNGICRWIIQANVPFSSEAIAAASSGGYASALRKIAKRREAIATCHPYCASIVGFGDSFLYCHGVLCYTIDDTIRILDLHRSTQREAVVTIPGLIRKAIFGSEQCLPGHLIILYYNEGIISCLYKLSPSSYGSWLLVFDVHKRKILLTQFLEYTEKLFARHDSKYLYYGTHSDIGNDGQKTWLVRGFGLEADEWFENKIHLQQLIGSDVGSTICFEIHDGYFYAVSNQTTLEVEEVDWTSFYHCVRFPADNPSMENLEVTDDRCMWRRQHLEGPIDDRWTTLCLDVDEMTGELKIVETRKEWLHGKSTGLRTCYINKIVFSDKVTDGETYLFDHGSSSSESSPLDVLSSSSFFSTSDSASSLLLGSSTFSASNSLCSRHALAALTQDRLALTLTPGDKPHFHPPQTRLPRNVHTESDNVSLPAFTLSNTPVKHYNTSANTFFDLINKPECTDRQSQQRLRFRVNSRKLDVLLTGENGMLLPEASDPRTGDIMDGLNEKYTSIEVTLWPPDPEDKGVFNDQLEDLYSLLNPPSHLGNVEGTMDERSMVFVTGGNDQPKAIVFISFDPTIRLDGLKRWGGDRTVAGLPPCRDNIRGEHSQWQDTPQVWSQENAGGLKRTSILDKQEVGKRKGKSIAVNAGSVAGATADTPFQEEVGVHPTFTSGNCGTSWIRTEDAMYKAINRGIDFAYHRHDGGYM